MLVLTRKAGESVIIDRLINVKVLSIKGRQIVIGIEAPKSVSIYRDDIKNIIKEPKEQIESARDGDLFKEGSL